MQYSSKPHSHTATQSHRTLWICDLYLSRQGQIFFHCACALASDNTLSKADFHLKKERATVSVCQRNKGLDILVELFEVINREYHRANAVGKLQFLFLLVLWEENT